MNSEPYKKQFFFTIDCDWIPGSEKELIGLLEVSKEFKLRTTLFVTGQFALSYPEIIKEALNYGYEIGSHGWEHGLKTDEDYGSANYNQQKKWINQSIQAIEKVTSKRPLAFRAPDLKINKTLLQILEEKGFLFDSSVPARRFDFKVGFRYFRTPLHPYHPSSLHFGREGNSPILEVPPSAYFIPINMSQLRRFGLGILKLVIKKVEKKSPILVFYCHPSEFTDLKNLTLPADEEPSFLKRMGPENFSLLKDFLSFIISRGYKPSFISEAKNKK